MYNGSFFSKYIRYFSTARLKIYISYFCSSPILTTVKCSHSPTKYATHTSPGDLGLFVLRISRFPSSSSMALNEQHCIITKYPMTSRGLVSVLPCLLPERLGAVGVVSKYRRHFFHYSTGFIGSKFSVFLPGACSLPSLCCHFCTRPDVVARKCEQRARNGIGPETS